MKEFKELFKKHITRDGADKLLEWLEKTDFFEAPASTRFHGSYKGGLVKHSVNVFNELVKLVAKETDLGGDFNPNIETLAIIGLLHDVCKANTYKIEMRNSKIDGKWEKVPYYAFDEKFTFGHGEKSVFLIERFMKLNVDEAVAIRYHMGAYEGEHAWRSLGNVYKQFPIALITHFADMRANHILENDK